MLKEEEEEKNSKSDKTNERRLGSAAELETAVLVQVKYQSSSTGNLEAVYKELLL